MSDHSNISWTDATWSPTLGCIKVSAGCTNCYAIRTAYRQEHAFKRPEYAGLTRRLPDGSLNWTGRVNVLSSRLNLPLTWRAPRRIFVDSQSDLFHDDVPNEFIAAVFGVMAWANMHTFQVLTKRPARMRDFIDRLDPIQMRRALWDVLRPTLPMPEWILYVDGKPPIWPLPNVWLGVSVEDQRSADERIPLLLQTPAAVRFLSCEPLIGPLDLYDYLMRNNGPDPDDGEPVYFRRDEPKIHWLIAGGESGPNYRGCDPSWVRSLRYQSQAAGVAFHFKQWGGQTHAAGGRLLDGRTWDEYPEPERELVMP